MIVVCQVNRATDQHYEGTIREFEEMEPALNYLMESFKNMYGTDAEYNVDFWDPDLKEQSSMLFSVELFAPEEDEGWYLFRDWERLH